MTLPQIRQGIAGLLREAFQCGTMSHMLEERPKRLRRNELARFYHWKRLDNDRCLITVALAAIDNALSPAKDLCMDSVARKHEALLLGALLAAGNVLAMLLDYIPCDWDVDLFLFEYYCNSNTLHSTCSKG